ncbi:hypothetical protein A2V61_02835 [Candidatus Woesebacteria bacterium RBG_19FT_COMBO_47_8]|uniref:dTDP-4-dehydrorhamnose reductase n=1 Tax=Candidatus Woesebacteria bacterium RBG_13_46_13 TaxID=1802479 RepID=A0A1F7X5S1_9BACT|nr:MAG: hypothetical protein A2Y68_02945 [Candidatus Woesebacteria bacterium RBG_13_46_13]OGM16491.1 MAG: hypothetical protein A2V61_02835 [Candidatus Woesebacteria bacterium RBG_19FT_COMBO_47_8]HJX59043.1 sugar nucleotide-binding protein [Patescibacteria group bacterium]
MKSKILAFGADGLVGSRFTDLYHKDSQFITPKIDELDITAKKPLSDYFEKNRSDFEVVINFAAITNVDAAEKERGNKQGLSWQVNVEGAKNIAENCLRLDKFLIHISTDFVFPGTKNNPGPSAEDTKLPETEEGLGWYGWTKGRGEEEIAKTGVKHAVLRITYPYRAHYPAKIDFARNILELFDEGKLYPMFSDQQMTPSFIDEIAKVLYLLVEEKRTGIFHAASADLTTPYDFAAYLLEKARGAKDVVTKGSMKEYLSAAGRTPRPIVGGLKVAKTESELGIKFMGWQEAIGEFIKQLNA